MPAQQGIPDWLTTAAIGLASGDLDAWMEMYADGAVHEFPFAGGGVRELKGKDAIRRYMASLGGSLRFGGLGDVHVHETDAGVVVEAEGHHVDAVTDEPFDLRYLWVITRRNGKVTRFRDYMAPRRSTLEQP